MPRDVKNFICRICQDAEEWEKQLSQCENPNIFASFAWGEFKSNSWKPQRLLFFKGETFVGLSQILFKSVGPFVFGWSPSGIQFTNLKYIPEILDALKNHYNLKRTLIRFNFFDEYSGEVAYLFDSLPCLSRVATPINSGYTININLNEYSPQSSLSKNHRYYLKKAHTFSQQSIQEDFSSEKFVATHSKMTEAKHLQKLSLNLEEMKQLKESLKDNCLTYSIHEKGEPLATCLILLKGTIALYYLAGATHKGRSQFSSFQMVDFLINDLREKGIKRLDFGGINPWAKSASGVDRFKKGFGGQVIKQVGEREITLNAALKPIFNLIVKFKLK